MSDAIDTRHLARLARLALDHKNTERLQTDLRNIIAMVDAMDAVSTEGVAPMAHPLDATQRLRRDEVTESVDRELLQASAPLTADGYYLVPRVVE